MSHVSSSDSLKDPEVSGVLVPSDPAGPRISTERRGSGPGPVVARRKSSDPGKEPRVGSWQERRSCSSLSEKEAESVVNGCVSRWSQKQNKKSETRKEMDVVQTVLTQVLVWFLRSAAEDPNVTQQLVQSNGLDHPEAGAVCVEPIDADAEC